MPIEKLLRSGPILLFTELTGHCEDDTISITKANNAISHPLIRAADNRIRDIKCGTILTSSIAKKESFLNTNVSTLCARPYRGHSWNCSG